MGEKTGLIPADVRIEQLHAALEVESLPRGMSLIFCTTPGRHKDLQMRAYLNEKGFEGAYGVEENPPDEMNYLETEYVAISKILRTVPRLLERILREGKIWDPRQQKRASVESGVILMANDIKLERVRTNGAKEAFNKPDPDSSPAELFEKLRNTIGMGAAREQNDGLGFQYFNLNSGLAAYDVQKERGVTALAKNQIELSYLSDAQLLLYMGGIRAVRARVPKDPREASVGGFDTIEEFYEIAKMEAKQIEDEQEKERQLKFLEEGIPFIQLLSVNGAIMWESVPLDMMIRRVNGVGRNEKGYKVAKQAMMQRAWGGAREMGLVLHALDEFKKGNGDYTSSVRNNFKGEPINVPLGKWVRQEISVCY